MKGKYQKKFNEEEIIEYINDKGYSINSDNNVNERKTSTFTNNKFRTSEKSRPLLNRTMTQHEANL